MKAHRLRLFRAVGTAVWLVAMGCSSTTTPGGGDASPTAVASAAPSATPSVRPTSRPSPTPDALSQRTDAELRIPGGPDFPIDAFGSLWLLTPDSSEPSITRLDPATNEIVATIPVGGRLCQAIGASEDAIWACTNGGVLRIDPETNEVAATVQFPTARIFGYLPFGDDALWALSGEVTLTNVLVRIDPSSNEVAATYELGFDASWLSYGDGAVWLSDESAGTVWRFDVDAEELSEHTTGLTQPGPSAFGAGSVWLGVMAGEENRERPAPTDITVVRIDPATGDVEAEFATGDTVSFGLIYAADDAVWVRSPTIFLTRIDPATDEIVEVLEANGSGGSVIVAHGSVWATSTELGRVWRLRP